VLEYVARRWGEWVGREGGVFEGAEEGVDDSEGFEE